MSIKYHGVIVGIRHIPSPPPPVGSPVTLRPEPDNIADSDAIAAYTKDQRIGYLPASNRYLKSKLSAGNIIVGKTTWNGASTIECDWWILNKQESKKHRNKLPVPIGTQP